MNDTPLQQADDERFVRRARALLDESAERIDGATRSRLTQARHAALAELERSRGFSLGRLLGGGWVPAGAMAAAAVLAVALWAGRPGEVAVPQVAESEFDAIELLSDAESLDLVDEDPAFYAWAMETQGEIG